MSSPIAHAGLIALIWPGIRKGMRGRNEIRRPAALFGLILCALMAPDGDVILGPLRGKSITEYHNGFSHSLTCAVLFAPLFGWLIYRVCGMPWRWGTLLSLACYLSHLALDAFSVGRGILLFWPFSDARVAGPPVFFGVRHSVNAPWTTHAWTVVSDSLFALSFLALSRAIYGRQRGAITAVAPQHPPP